MRTAANSSSSFARPSFWIRSRLQELGIPYTFVGTAIEGSDDIGVNILPRRTLNLLYNLIDLYAVTSRWE